MDKIIDLFYWPTPNGWKVSIALEEMKLPFKTHEVNISKGDQFEKTFLDIAPNNRIPAIKDYQGPEGQEISLFESGAILHYLALKTSSFIGNNDFMLTYGDGVSDVNITELVEFHRSHGKHISMTAVQPAGRYGALDIKSDNSILSFKEKPKGDGAWVNGGFFVCKPEVFDYIDGDFTSFEEEPLSSLADNNQLAAFKHNVF